MLLKFTVDHAGAAIEGHWSEYVQICSVRRGKRRRVGICGCSGENKVTKDQKRERLGFKVDETFN